MMDLQRQKVKNMVDPYGTYESVMDYLAIRPDAQRELFRYINGGVEVKGISCYWGVERRTTLFPIWN